MLPRFGTPAQRASDARFHTSLVLSPPFFGSRASPLSLSHCTRSLPTHRPRRTASQPAPRRLFGRPLWGQVPQRRLRTLQGACSALELAPRTRLAMHTHQHGLTASLRDCRRLLVAMSLAPHRPAYGYHYLLFGSRTLRCVSCVLAPAAALPVDRRAFRVSPPAAAAPCPGSL